MWAAAVPFPCFLSQTHICKPKRSSHVSEYPHQKHSFLDNQIPVRFLGKPVTFRGFCLPASSGDSLNHQNQELSNNQEKKGVWQMWKENSAEMSAKLAKLGLAAVLAYGIFDAVTYTSFFVLAFLGYEKSTGKNPAANIKALLGIVILMWAGNNVTRPFRIAGAAALAPVIDKGLRRMQKYFNLPTLAYAFALVVGVVAGICLTIVGLLVLSKWGR